MGQTWKVAEAVIDQGGIPYRLERDAILEAVFEMRFTSSRGDLSSILPGMLYRDLSDLFPNSQQLPISMVPPEMRSMVAPMVAYQPTHALTGKSGTLRFGPKTIALSIQKPYVGWDKFKALIVRCVQALARTSFVEQVERCSLKYTNLLNEGTSHTDLSQLAVKLDLGGFNIGKSSTHIRAEISHRNLVNIVQVISGATVTIANPQPTAFSGVVLDVDSIREGPVKNFEDNFSEVLDEIHTVEKEVFFGLLTDTTIKKLGPRGK